MTKIIKIELFAILLIAIGIVWEFIMPSQSKFPVSRIVTVPVAQATLTPNPKVNAQFMLDPTKVITPTTVPTQTASQISPDGTKELYLTTTSNPDGTKDYVLTSENADGSNKQTVYTASESASVISIPFDTWSPDDKYVFVIRTFDNQTNALAMREDGQPITTNQHYINITKLFSAQNTNFTYDQTTGWASDNLLIINTKAAAGTQGTSYWFDVTNESFTPLATKF